MIYRQVKMRGHYFSKILSCVYFTFSASQFLLGSSQHLLHLILIRSSTMKFIFSCLPLSWVYNTSLVNQNPSLNLYVDTGKKSSHLPPLALLGLLSWKNMDRGLPGMLFLPVGRIETKLKDARKTVQMTSLQALDSVSSEAQSTSWASSYRSPYINPRALFFF